MTTFALRGTVVNEVQTPQAGATVRLFSLGDPLAGDPRAAVLNPGAVTWTRRIRGFQGNAWNAWQKFVAAETAAITWPEFRAALSQYNPSLAASGGDFQPGESYVLPENKALEFARSPYPDILWDRPLSVYEGTLWACWQQFVQNKVIGLNWKQFRSDMFIRYPHLAESRGKLSPYAEYMLPRNADHDRYYRLAFSDANGRFDFPELLPGEYGLEVMADGFQRYRQELVIAGDDAIVVELIPIPLVIEKGTEDFVQVQGTEFVLQGRTFRFIGVNLRGLVHYGDRSTLQHAEDADRMEQLSKASEMGARVVRVFLPSEHADTGTVIARLEQVLGLMRTHFPHMRLIVALTNLYSDNPFRVQNDTDSYQQPAKETNDYKLLLPAWFEGGPNQGYERHYKPFVTAVVTRFRNEPLIMAWEPGNELKVDDNPDLFVRFLLAMTRHIKTLVGANQLVTTGIISTRVAYMADKPDLQRKLYGDSSIDFITTHAYNGTNEEDDSGLAQMLGKPFIIEETGFDAGKEVPSDHIPPCVKDGQRRLDCVRDDMKKWFDRGARGYMPWGFMAGFNNGDGDSWSGMDHVLHGDEDWRDLFDAYRAQASVLAQQSTAVAMPVKTTAAPKMALQAGMSARTTGEVFVRRSPGHLNKLAVDVLGKTRTGATVNLLGSSEEHDGLVWWPVRTELQSGATVEGWMAQANENIALLVA